MFSTIGYILLFLLVLSVVICIHELGHFYFARKAGILCHEFSFGMGPKIWSRKYGETEFVIRAIPFGGYVSMAGEELEAEILEVGKKIRIGLDENNEINRIIINPANVNFHDFKEITIEEYNLSKPEGERLYINEYTVKRNAKYVFDKKQIQIAPSDRSFSFKTKWQRFKVTFGGPLMNLILAFIVYLAIAFGFGVPDGNSTVVSAVSSDMPAASIIQPGDEIVAINGVSIDSWSGISNSVTSELNKPALQYDITVMRNGVEEDLAPIYPIYYFNGLRFAVTLTDGKLIISDVLSESEDFPIKAGDELLKIDGQSITDIFGLINFAQNYTEGSHPDTPTEFTVLRNNEEVNISYVTFGEKVLNALNGTLFASRIGINGSSKFSFFGSFAVAGENFAGAATSVYRTLGVLISTDQVHLSDLSGFVGIYKITERAAAAGLFSLLSWVGLLSVNLGIVNLLPIPALDGGRLVFIGYEAITGKKPNQKFENWLHTIVFFLLIGLMIYVTYYDILRFILHK